jgi:hypothetical protein
MDDWSELVNITGGDHTLIGKDQYAFGIVRSFDSTPFTLRSIEIACHQ